MAIITQYLAIFLLFTAVSVLGEPKQCYTCAGHLPEQCSGLEESDFDKDKAKYVQTCPPKTAGIEEIMNQLAAKDYSDSFGAKMQTSLTEQLTSIKAKAEADFEWACIKVVATHENWPDNEYGFRGCFPSEIVNRDSCEYFEHAVGLLAGDYDYCDTCSDDLCNSAVSISTMSMVAVVFVALLGLFL